MSEETIVDLDELKKSIDSFLVKWTSTNFPLFTNQDFFDEYRRTVHTLAEKEREHAPKRFGSPIRIDSTTNEGIVFFHRRAVYFLQCLFETGTKDDWKEVVRILTRILAVEEATLMAMHKIHPEFVDFLVKDIQKEPFVRVPLWLAEKIPNG